MDSYRPSHTADTIASTENAVSTNLGRTAAVQRGGFMYQPYGGSSGIMDIPDESSLDWNQTFGLLLNVSMGAWHSVADQKQPQQLHPNAFEIASAVGEVYPSFLPATAADDFYGGGGGGGGVAAQLNVSAVMGAGEATNGGSSGMAHAQTKQLLKTSMSMVVVLSIAYAVVFILGVVNNSLVVSVIYRNPQLRTVTNYFIANLAVADILVCIVVLPITLLNNLFTEWWYGLFLCKAFPYLQGVSVGASVNTLAAVAIERYLAIFYPQTSKLTARAAIIMIVIIWIVPMCIFIPWTIVFTIRVYPYEGHSYMICLPVWRSDENQKMYNLGAMFLTCYLIPLTFIAICYLLIGVRVWRRRVLGIRGSRAERNINRSKIRIVRMLLAVFVIFVVSWLPLYAIRLRFLFGPKVVGVLKNVLRTYLFPVAQWLGSSNSCVNPFIYCYFSTSFRRSILVVFRTRSFCGTINT